jgi:methylenetetrahydrofolate reductase (NADPH)
MRIVNFAQLARFSDACGAEIPRWVRLRMQGLGDDSDSIRSIGLDVVTDLCDRLLSSRRARPALLHHEPDRTHFDDLAAAGVVAAARRKCGAAAGVVAAARRKCGAAAGGCSRCQA